MEAMSKAAKHCSKGGASMNSRLVATSQICFEELLSVELKKAVTGRGCLRKANPGAFPNSGPIGLKSFSFPENAQTLDPF